MATDPHRVGRFAMHAAVADTDTAMALRPRIEALTWRTIPGVIEQVCDAIDPGQHLHIARLDLDLGRVSAEHMEEETLAALERALAEALREALHDARLAPSDAARLLPPQAARIDRLETYLTSGMSPYAPEGATFVPRVELLATIAEDPDALAAMLRRHGRHQRLLERLVLQLGGEGLRALVAILAPADATTIVALVTEVIVAHRLEIVAPAVPFAEPALERLLWITTLEFLLRDAGSQFNRRRFLDALLRREAAHAGIDHTELLRLLHRGITAARNRSGFRSSLPIVLSELLAEHDRAPDIDVDEMPPPLDADSALAAARMGDFAALTALVRQRAGDRVALEAIVTRLDAPLFAGLVRTIEPANADAIVAIVEDVALLNRAAPLLVADGLERMLRWLTLRYLLYDAGSGFNRRRFVAHLLEREAARAGISYSLLLQLMHEAAQRSRARIGFRSSLPATLGELLGETATEPRPAPAKRDPTDLALVAARQSDLAPLIALLRRTVRSKDFAAIADRLEPALHAVTIARLKPASALTIRDTLGMFEALHRIMPLAALSERGFGRLLRRVALADLVRDTNARFHRGTWLRRLIGELARETGVSNDALRETIARALRTTHAPSSMLTQELAEEISRAIPPASAGDAAMLWAALDSDRTAAAARLLELAGSPALLLHAAGALDERQWHRLLIALAPDDAASITEELHIFARLHRAEALGSWSARSFDVLLWSLAFAHLATRRGERFDRDALIRHLLRGLARHDGEPESVVKSRVAHALGLVASDRPSFTTTPRPDRDADARQAIESFLRTGISTAGGPALVQAAQQQPAWLAALVRRLARERPGALPALVDRLLERLLPDEVFALLLPGGSAQWRGLRNADAAILRSALKTLLDTGQLPPTRQPRTAARYDRVALLAHWLDHGAPPWWAAPGTTFASLIQQATLAELTAALTREEEPLDRLRRAGALLGLAQRDALIVRLAPWASPRDGPLRTPSGMPVDGDLSLRAIAATLAGEPFDLDALRSSPARPVRMVPMPPIATDPTADVARLLAWLDGAPANAAEEAELARLFAKLADAGNRRLRDHVLARRNDQSAPERWAHLLPGEALARLLDLLAPASAVPSDAVMLLSTAWRQIAPFGARRPSEAETWAIVLGFAAMPKPPSVVVMLDRLVTTLAGDDEASARELRTRALHLARDGGHLAVAATLRRAMAPSVAPPSPASPKDPKRAQAEPRQAPSEPEEPGHAIYIANAGLVLLNPYLPALFERLGVLTLDADGKPRIEGTEAMSRAAHLLQYCADGRLDAPEPALVLNKLLCGIPSGKPLLPVIEAAPGDLEICDGLLDALIANWPIIRNTSRAGLRETFLQRQGRLRHADGQWTLHVQRKGLDVLVDQIPWSIAMIYHRWMPEPVHVTW